MAAGRKTIQVKEEVKERFDKLKESVQSWGFTDSDMLDMLLNVFEEREKSLEAGLFLETYLFVRHIKKTLKG